MSNARRIDGFLLFQCISPRGLCVVCFLMAPSPEQTLFGQRLLRVRNGLSGPEYRPEAKRIALCATHATP